MTEVLDLSCREIAFFEFTVPVVVVEALEDLHDVFAV